MTMNNTPKESIAVIGGGMTGVAAALGLAKTGIFDVILIEKSDRLGGLSRHFQWQDVVWDQFYHVILSTDNVLLEFLKELKIEGELFWRETKSGFYGDGRLVSMSTILDFIRFPFLSLWQKFRLGFGILYCTRIKNIEKLDRLYAREWLTRVFGRRVYEKLWDPLLRSKFGNERERSSAAFIWATIHRLYGTRNTQNKTEKMGHVHGGYHKILKAAESLMDTFGVKVLTGHPVENIVFGHAQSGVATKIQTDKENENKKGKHLKREFVIHSNGKEIRCDNVLLTIDCPSILKIIGNQMSPSEQAGLAKIDYLGVICLVLILERRLSPYYVINLLDTQLPFTGVIEATNVVSSAQVGGKHIVYLPKYLMANDPFYRYDDDKIKTLFLTGLKKIYPNLKDTEILKSTVIRERFVQPFHDLKYLDRNIGIQTSLKNLFMVNTSMIKNSTLNNNAAIDLAKEAVSIITQEK
jgi:protoporphyrinogen oxidase